MGDALGGLKKLVGTNAKFEVQGVPGLSTVKKIFDHSGNVAQLHDIRYSNMVCGGVVRWCGPEFPRPQVQCVIELVMRFWWTAVHQSSRAPHTHTTQEVTASAASPAQDASKLATWVLTYVGEIEGAPLTLLLLAERPSLCKTWSRGCQCPSAATSCNLRCGLRRWWCSQSGGSAAFTSDASLGEHPWSQQPMSPIQRACSRQ